MKLITINTHSLIENDCNKKLIVLANAIKEEMPDLIAMQEVNQTRTSVELKSNPFLYNDFIVREDNYAASLLNELEKLDIKYYCVWLPVKIGYDKYDEGLAILSRLPILNIDNLLISNCNNYSYWKTRRILGVNTKKGWFYSVHMGWWQDDEEPFYKQWEKLNEHLKYKENVWLMGDFNSAADIMGEGYDLITSSGWYDSYKSAKLKDDGFTVTKQIDGWRNDEIKKMRIDYIFNNFNADILKSKVIFNDINHAVISDHYGIIIETKE